MSADVGGRHRAMRLQKYLSRAGVASRREGERLIVDGRVSVDGEVVKELGTRVVPGEHNVRVDGKLVEPRALRWLALHKPVGYVTTRSDDRGRPTLYALLPERYADLSYVGRLDLLSEGLLILTNDGELIHRLLHPSYEVPRRYEVEVEGQIDPRQARRLVEGVMLEDGPADADDIEVGGAVDGRSSIRLTLREGRNREVRRMLAALDYAVERLVRLAYGPIELGALGPGEWRELTPAEIRALRACVDLGEPDGNT